MNDIKGGTPLAILGAYNNTLGFKREKVDSVEPIEVYRDGKLVNVGTPGHLDHGEYSDTMKRFLLTQSTVVNSCTCLTKTPILSYHHFTCKYKRDMEKKVWTGNPQET